MLFLLAACGGGGGGGGSGGGQGILSVDLAFTPGDRQVKVDLVEKGPLTRLLNISSYQLTAIDSANETVRIEGNRLAEAAFNGSVLTGLTNDRNYTFSLRVFYFPVGSTELSNLSLRIDYAEEANSENDRAGDGITIGSNRDGDYLADLVDADDDNDGLNDLDNDGTALDDCPRGDTGWRSNKTTDNDGDGCRDAGEDSDDDNDNVTDSEDLGEYEGRECHLFADCDNDTLLDAEDLGEFNGTSCRAKPDCDDDTIADTEDNCPVISNSNQMDWDGDETGDSCDMDDDNDGVNDVKDDCQRGEVGWRSNKTTDNDGDGCRDEGEDSDDDNDNVTDSEDLGEYEGRECHLFADCDNDTLLDAEDLGEFNGEPCRAKPDCDNDTLLDAEDLGEFNGEPCRAKPDCDNDTLLDAEDLGEFNGEPCRAKPDCDNDTLLDAEDLGEFNGEPCRAKPDCDDDTLLDAEDNCPAITSSNRADGDGDGAGDACDLDADGDGLIEIGTAAELNAVRWTLDGSGRRMSEMAVLDQTGCANGAGNEDDCNGYELIRNISLAAYAGGSGWEPLGSDTDSRTTGCQGTPFSGIFDGNGWTVRELSINRSGEDCIGLFGHLAAGTVIRNLTVRADSVIGRNIVGGLVGSGGAVEIVSLSSVVDSVSGGGVFVGGLVGYGDDAEIVSSLSVADSVSGSGVCVGGLVGWGEGAEIVSSSSVAGQISGDGVFVGGLVGYGDDAEIVSSYSVAGSVSGSGWIGGLVGYGNDAEIVSSYSVAGSVSGSSNNVGGLVGWGEGAEIVSSSSVAGQISGNINVGGLVGFEGDVDSSYWHTAVAVAGNRKGEEKTLAELRTPTNDNAYDASSIYADWADGANIDDTAGVENITIYCDEDLSDAIETDEMRDGSGSGSDNRIWDFGGTNDYPAIRCSPQSLTEQRSWWFINLTTNRPQINQGRLDRLTSP